MAMQLPGQNARGLTDLEMEKMCLFMGDRGIQEARLAEIWRVTPNVLATEETSGGYLTIRHGQRTKKMCAGGYWCGNFLSSKAHAAWGLGVRRIVMAAMAGRSHPRSHWPAVKRGQWGLAARPAVGGARRSGRLSTAPWWLASATAAGATPSRTSSTPAPRPA